MQSIDNGMIEEMAKEFYSVVSPMLDADVSWQALSPESQQMFYDKAEKFLRKFASSRDLPGKEYAFSGRLWKREDQWGGGNEWVLEFNGTIDSAFSIRHAFPGNIDPEDVLSLPGLKYYDDPAEDQEPDGNGTPSL